MVKVPGSQDFPFNHEFPHTGCAPCPAREYELCQAVRKLTPETEGRTWANLVLQSEGKIKQRRVLTHQRHFSGFVPVICGGWAAAISALPDGRRQILSFLLPGDFIWGALFSEGRQGSAIETITEVHYRNYNRRQLKQHLFSQPQILDGVLNMWMDDLSRIDGLVVDLGRRSGEERVSRLILGLAQRLKGRGMTSTDQPLSMEFPLRQHHIADATGLTQVHASKIISKLRREAIVEVRGRRLTILQLEQLCRIGNVDDRYEGVSLMLGSKI